ncbi:MAG TPA: NAD(P)/FAD-dependent oxidoreductase [Capsulimonadaceae bacterium]|jgi:thioredoxin reductase (NADPH)
MHDALIIGGGPAGLSAAVYLGRFRRRVLVLDEGKGRSSFSQINENYLGFPDGVSTRELRELGRKQAERFGAEFADCVVEAIERTEMGFVARCGDRDYEGLTVLFATGVCDIWPDIAGIERWIGCGVFWCITCDGFHAIDKRIVCLGNDDEAATTALQFLLYTREVTLIVDPGHDRISDLKRAELVKYGVGLVSGHASSIEASSDGSSIAAICLEGGQRLECDMIFSLLGVTPNTGMAKELDVTTDEQGYIEIDDEGYTNVPGVFAAGDLTKMYTQQVASAVHAGAEAAQTMNYYLYASFQKNVDDCLPEATPEEAALVGSAVETLPPEQGGPINVREAAEEDLRNEVATY